MSDFQWDPASSQIYDSSFGNTTQTGTGAQFSKRSGTGFTMNAPECELTLNVTDGKDVDWPLMDGEVDSFLDMYFEKGIFNLETQKGDIYLGMKSDHGSHNYSKNISLDVAESTVSILAPNGAIVIGGRDKSFLQTRYNGTLLIQALQMDFCAGNINCSGQSHITCAAVKIEAQKVDSDTQGANPVFNLITDSTHTPQIEFKNPLDITKTQWNFSPEGKNRQGIFNFVTNEKDDNKNGKFMFNGAIGFPKAYLLDGGFLAINGTVINGTDAVNSLFNVKPIILNGSTVGCEISLK
ncbi:hypothetical protein [Trabulsiella odontotermitis]|uniref:Uncharacterized protein n=1 Tax=Trabulsiella odontotermitis TaxID=379893 RepID=A0A0L0GTX4_9ENTR|nr:hypothetical protein [Trabulsiella odontotermitis]KNC92216.1 hypothetical protein GM31_00175 [Trabulsiella odontotermitis]